MTKEKLLEWGLSEEQANKVMEGLNGAFVTKARFNEVNAELAKAKTTVQERDSQLEALKQASGDAKALQEEIARLQADNARQQKEHEAQLRTQRIESAVELALTAAKARNNTAVRALMADFIGKAEIDGDGRVKGLAEEVKRLSEGKETAFLFEAPQEKKFKGAKAAEKGDQAAGEMTLETFRALSPAQRLDYSVNHPEEYRQLYGGNE